MSGDKLDRTGTGSLFASSITQVDMDAAAKTLARLAVRNQASATDLALSLGAIGYLDAAKALQASLWLADPGSRPATLETVSDSRHGELGAVSVAPVPRWCKCDDTKHDMNDPKQAVFRKDGSRECRVGLNKRRRAKKARKAAEKGTP